MGTEWRGWGLTSNGYVVENVLTLDVTVAQFSKSTTDHVKWLCCVVWELILRKLFKREQRGPVSFI